MKILIVVFVSLLISTILPQLPSLKQQHITLIKQTYGNAGINAIYQGAKKQFFFEIF